MKKYFFKTRFASIILIAAGYGWAGGHFIPVNSAILGYLVQFVILTVVLIMGAKFLSIAESDKHEPNWSIRGLGIITVLSLLVNISNIIHGALSNASSFGSHDSLADLIPISLLMLGNILWIITIFQSSREATKVKYILDNHFNIL